MFLDSPGSNAACPNVAACWSPRTPAIGTPATAAGAEIGAITPEDGRISGSIERGMPNTSSICGDQSSVRRSIRSVRLAFVTSVTWRAPPVRFQTSQVSGVPNSRCPASASSRAPGTCSRIQAILDAEKYAASGSPVMSA